jgi:dTMP kinase
MKTPRTRPQKTGKFIVIEGIDGAGTTTQSKHLVDWMNQQGHKAIGTCEPSHGPIGQMLRQILSGRLMARKPGGQAHPMCNDVIALLFAADRMDHLDGEILPLLGSGIHVVSDRYLHSSFTYQALQGNLSWIRSLNANARSPDVTYVLDVPSKEAQRRRERVRASSELYEKLRLQTKLERAYRRLPKMLPRDTIVVVDGSLDMSVVFQTILSDLRRRLGW